MNQPSPAIVAQDAVRRLPRWALLLLCVAYVIPGYVGRDPWKNADIAAFGTMLELQAGGPWSDWLRPALMGVPTDTGALLPYWLGAWVLQLAPAWMAPEFAVRLPKDAAGVVDALVDKGVLAGVPGGRLWPGNKDMANVLIVAATETNTPADMDKFAAALSEVL